MNNNRENYNSENNIMRKIRTGNYNRKMIMEMEKNKESESRRGSLRWNSSSCDSNQWLGFGSAAVNRRACRINDIHSTIGLNFIEYLGIFWILLTTISGESLLCNVNQQITRTISYMGLDVRNAVVCSCFTSDLWT